MSGVGSARSGGEVREGSTRGLDTGSWEGSDDWSETRSGDKTTGKSGRGSEGRCVRWKAQVRLWRGWWATRAALRRAVVRKAGRNWKADSRKCV